MIGNGVVVDLSVLFDEIDGLTARGVDCSRLLVSANAHIIAPYNRTIDKVTERFLGNRKIGTTGRGIGPTYADKMNRVGIRVQDLFDEHILRQKVEGALDAEEPPAGEGLQPPRDHRRRGRRGAAARTPSGCGRWSRTPRSSSARRSTAARPCSSRAARRRCSTSTTAPTRSSRRPTPTSAGACTGSGVPPTRIDRVIAVVKAYATRVGEGPFPTELLDDGRRAAARRRRRVRDDDRPPAPLRLVRRPGRPLRRADQRRHRLRADQARRAHRAGEAPGLRRLRRRRRPARRDADDADRLPPRQAGLRVLRRLERGHQRRPLVRGPAEERPALRAGPGGDVRRRISAVGVGPDRDATVVRHDLLG